MKSRLLPVVFCCLALGLAPANVQGQIAAEELVATSAEDAPVGPHHRVSEWTTTTTELDSAGNPVEVEIQNRCILTATGLNWLNPISQSWEPSVEAFTISPQGYALAVQGQTKLILAPNINEGASVDVELPDGQRLRLNPMGISYFCAATGKNILLGEVKESAGELVEPNVVAYFDAFDTVKAALRYTYRLASIEQDVVLYANPGPPEAFGLSGDSVSILIYSEVHDGVAPEVRGIERDDGVIEQELSFGSAGFGRGTAYFLGAEFDAVPVRTSWVEAEGRQFLVEEIAYREVEPLLQKLAAKAPVPTAAQLAGRTVSGRAGMVAKLSRRTTGEVARVASILPGKDRSEPGLLFDFVILNTSQTNAVFSGTETYWLRNQVLLFGSNTTFSAGAVFKASNSAGIKLVVNTPVTWGGSVAQPIVFTGQDDSSIGQKLTTNAMSGTYATVALEINTNTVTLDHLRVVGAKTGVLLNGAGPHTLRHVQMVDCEQGIKGTNTEFRLRNGLFWNVKTNFTGSGTTGRVEHLTTDGALRFNDGLSVLTVTNSLLVAVTDLGSSFTSVGSATNDGTGGVFMGVGTGQHYLAAGSGYRNYVGASTNLDGGLLKELRQMTTYPPLVLTNDFTASTTLSPQAQRDTDVLDLGYHYDPLDYCWSGLKLTNATLTLTNGVAVGLYGTQGVILQSGAKVYSEGTPTAMNRLVHHTTVQEQPQVWVTNTPFLLFPLNGTLTVTPEVRLRFTDISFLANTTSNRKAIYDGGFKLSASLQDCWLRNGYVYVYGSTANPITLALTNNLIRGSHVEVFAGYYGTPYLLSYYGYNNLFKGGTFILDYVSSYSPVALYDNLFDTVTTTVTVENPGSYPLPAATNAFKSTTAFGSGNKTLTVCDYQTGPLGAYYYPTNGGSTNLYALLNAGTRNATNAGLYHFTVRVDQAKETNSIVDIGYHYVAVGADGQPVDTDGDGIADYFEDRNGNGTRDGGETSFTNADTDADGMPDEWESNNGLNPLSNDASDDPDGDWQTNLQEYQAGTSPCDTMVVAWGEDLNGQCQVPINLRDVIQTGGGLAHSVALRKAGAVAAWGDNAYGQTNVPTGLTNAAAVAAGVDHGIAAKADGSVTAWGSWWNSNGHQPATVPPGLSGIVSVAAGENHDLALRVDGTVVAWGATNAVVSYTNVPVGLGGVSAVAAGWNHSLALRSDGTVVAWGDSFSGLGWNITSVPAGLNSVVAIATGGYHTLALKADGTVVAWGAGNTTNRIWWADFEQSVVPAGLSGVVAVAAGGYSSLALKRDGTIVAWGEHGGPGFSLTNVVGIGLGENHGLAIRAGRLTPLIAVQPVDRAAVAGTNVTFTARGLGLAGVTYQWQRDGVNLAGATNAILTLNNVSGADEASYQVIITTGAGSVISEAATFTLVERPQILSLTPAAPSTNWFLFSTNLTVSATAEATNAFPLTYVWKRNGVAFKTNGALCLLSMAENQLDWCEADFSVEVSNAAGTTNAGPWRVRAALAGMTAVWGAAESGQLERPATLTNAIAIAAGDAHGLAVRDNGGAVAWGANSYGQTNAPTTLTNGVSCAAGTAHSLVVKANGGVAAWGRNNYGQTNAPSNLTNAIAVSACGNQSLALKADGTVVQWGQTFATVPGSLTNAIAIASGTNFHLALRRTGAVVAWGNNSNGQLNVPASLTNAVAIAAGGSHALALRTDGTLVAWGANGSGEGTVPSGLNLTNVMAIAAGSAHNLALRNDGTLVAWGDNSVAQTNCPTLIEVKLLAAGGRQCLASRFSALVTYTIDVSKDLLLIYNSNPSSTNSLFVKDYYLAHRPLVSNANVLGVNCAVGETFLPEEYTNDFAAAVQSWLLSQPTKRPQYVILFLDIPSRVCTNNTPGVYIPNTLPSVQYRLATGCASAGWTPFVTHINMGTTNDCRAYIDKLEFVGTNYSPGRVLLSASRGGYGNANYLLDNIRHGTGYISPATNGDYSYSGSSHIVAVATNGLLANGVQPSAITYSNELETTEWVDPNWVRHNCQHPSTATNLAGYICWGAHSSLGSAYAVNQSLQWQGNSGWWIIETVESFNGQRAVSYQGTFVKWFSASAFGGVNHSNTPIGAVCYVDEPLLAWVSDARIYFGLWAGGKTFAAAAWQSCMTPYLMAVGDPLVTR